MQSVTIAERASSAGSPGELDNDDEEHACHEDANVNGPVRVRQRRPSWRPHAGIFQLGARESGTSGQEGHRMFTLFQRTLIVVLVFGFLVVALVVAAKAPAQATTFAPALSLPVNAVIPPGIVTTGDATVKAKPDGAIVTVGTIAQEATADEAQAQLSGRIAKILERAKALAIADSDTKTVS